MANEVSGHQDRATVAKARRVAFLDYHAKRARNTRAEGLTLPTLYNDQAAALAGTLQRVKEPDELIRKANVELTEGRRGPVKTRVGEIARLGGPAIQISRKTCPSIAGANFNYWPPDDHDHAKGKIVAAVEPLRGWPARSAASS